MSSHARHSRHKTNIPKALRHGEKKRPSSHRKNETLSLPQAPAELNAILGYGTSASFPLFTAGVTTRIRKAFGRKNTRG